MDNELLDVSADVDVDDLMARIRESVKNAKSSSPPRFAAPVSRRNLQPIEIENILQEVYRGGSLTEVINQIPLKRRGWKGRLELRAKKLLKWVVHWNTKAQADFNRSVMNSLGLVAHHLQAVQKHLVTTERRLTEESTRRAEIDLQVRESLGQVYGRLEEIVVTIDAAALQQLALEKRINEQVEQKRINEQVEQKRINEQVEQLRYEMNQRINEQVTHISAVLGETSSKVDAVGVHSSELEQRVCRESEQMRYEMNCKINEQVAHLSAIVDEIATKADATIATSSGVEQKVSHDLDEIRMRILRVARAVRANGQAAGTAESFSDSGLTNLNVHGRESATDGRAKPGTSVPQVSSKLQDQPFDYFLFEHRYRGSTSEIKQRQSAYLELFLDRQNVVDLGCGRGEFVELLSEKGINVTGVDNNQDMAEFCQDRGLRVILADMFEYLSSLPDASLDGIFTSQVVEHLSPERILVLINLCGEKLKPGGVIVAETVNTNCPIALSNFYLDPTHVRPVPPEMLKFMFEREAFRVQTFRFSSPLAGSNVSAVLDTASGFAQEGSVYQDYAVVATRRQSRSLELNAIVEDGIEESSLSKY